MICRGTIALLIGLIGVAAAHAEDAVRAPSWSLGGAALAASDSARITMWQDKDGMSAGIQPASASLTDSWKASGGLQTGGFLAWQSSIYRVDATFSSSLDG
jgi:hypothetical protein